MDGRRGQWEARRPTSTSPTSRAGRQLHRAQHQRRSSTSADEVARSTSRARSSRARPVARATSSSTPRALQRRLVDAGDIMAPRARPHARLPPRAHAPRGRHLLRGQQLARADAVRLGVDHALPAVQRHVRRPVDDRPGPRRRACPLRRLIHRGATAGAACRTALGPWSHPDRGPSSCGARSRQSLRRRESAGRARMGGSRRHPAG